MKLKMVALGAGLALAASATAALAEPGARVEERVVVMGGPGGADADKDGAVSRAEFNAMHDRMWSKMDKDGNGRLDKDEMGGHGEGRRVFMMEHDGPGHPGGMGHGPGHRAGMEGHGPRHEVHIVRRGGEGLDANRDGRLSLDEFTAPMRDHFKEADTNRNGFLDKDEMGGDGDRFVIRHVDKREE